jgi:hypothetical protein
MGTVIEGINWETKTFTKAANETPAEPKPKPLKPEKKKPVIIEVMPGATLPNGYTDYRQYLQRDGLILLAWEIYDDEWKIVWCTANRGMMKYQAWVADESGFSAICPESRYHEGRHSYCTGEAPEFIIYTAPPDLTANTRNAFVAKLRATGVSVNFDYEFSLGKQKAARETAVFDKIVNYQNCLSSDEAEFLEVYRQLDDNFKLDLIERMKALLRSQGA